MRTPSLLSNSPITATLAVALAACATGASLQAQSADAASAVAHQPERAWLEIHDPTLIARRLLLKMEYEDQAADALQAKWLANLRWSVALGQDLALGLQLETPFVWRDHGDGTEDFGFGDLEARAGIVGRIAKGTRWGLGMNGKFPTAADGVGDEVVELKPLLVISHDLADWLNLGCNVEYAFTLPGEDDGWVQALEVKFPVAVRLGGGFSAFASYNPRRDGAANSMRHRLELALTRTFGAEDQFALTAGAELPLAGEDGLDWKGGLGFIWTF